MSGETNRKIVAMRLPEETRKKMIALSPLYGSQAGVVIVAVAALYREQAGTDAVEPVKVEA